MKILELTNYSAGICGVWQRVKQESLELAKRGHEVLIFSSNAVKGFEKKAKHEDFIRKIKIRRFPFKKLGGESFMYWDFEKEALQFMPDIIIAHSYRHLHTARAIKIAEKIRKKGKTCKVFLVTHAPFDSGRSTRNLAGKIAVTFYDIIIGKRIINKFNRVIAITKWEMPFLNRIGCRKEKISYIPNGIPREFFLVKPKRGENLLFLGRISPVKDLETLIKAMKNQNLNLDIVGPWEIDYKSLLDELIKNESIHNVKFFQPVFDINKKIRLIDKHEIFILPSKREGMPQSLVEAMARGKIVIASSTNGSKEIINNNKNGFLFNIGNDVELNRCINKVQEMSIKKKERISKEAIKTSRRFKWDNIIRDLEGLF